MDSIIGPCLPPHLRKTEETNVEESAASENKSIIGPCLPPHLRKYSPSKSEPESNANIGPCLPTHLKEEDKSIVGPCLPPHLRKSKEETNGPHLPPKEENKSVIGPCLPPHLRQSLHTEESHSTEPEIEEQYGPLPVGMSNYRSSSDIALEERALQIQIDNLDSGKNNAPARESWMIDLPEARTGDFGLGPRQFRNRAGPDMSDRSSWTTVAGSTNKGKETKVDLKAEAELREMQKRDKEQELITKKHKRKSTSLVEMHKEKNKKTKSASSNERRPFSRETDLQVNKFDEAQKNAVLKKAQLLDDRFNSGKSKFL